MTTPSLSAIRAQCVIEDHHWLWTGPTNDTGHPCCKHDGSTRTVRRLVLHAQRGRALARTYLAVCTCDWPACVSPECVAATTIAKVRQAAAARGAYRQNAMRHARIAATRRARSHVSDETIRYIRSSTAPGVVLAAELGLQPSYISAVRTGRLRRELATPWAGLHRSGA